MHETIHGDKTNERPHGTDQLSHHDGEGVAGLEKVVVDESTNAGHFLFYFDDKMQGVNATKKNCLCKSSGKPPPQKMQETHIKKKPHDIRTDACILLADHTTKTPNAHTKMITTRAPEAASDPPSTWNFKKNPPR